MLTYLTYCEMCGCDRLFSGDRRTTKSFTSVYYLIQGLPVQVLLILNINSLNLSDINFTENIEQTDNFYEINNFQQLNTVISKEFKKVKLD